MHKKNYYKLGLVFFFFVFVKGRWKATVSIFILLIMILWCRLHYVHLPLTSLVFKNEGTYNPRIVLTGMDYNFSEPYTIHTKHLLYKFDLLLKFHDPKNGDLYILLQS